MCFAVAEALDAFLLILCYRVDTDVSVDESCKHFCSNAVVLSQPNFSITH